VQLVLDDRKNPLTEQDGQAVALCTTIEASLLFGVKGMRVVRLSVSSCITYECIRVAASIGASIFGGDPTSWDFIVVPCCVAWPISLCFFRPGVKCIAHFLPDVTQERSEALDVPQDFQHDVALIASITDLDVRLQ